MPPQRDISAPANDGSASAPSAAKFYRRLTGVAPADADIAADAAFDRHVLACAIAAAAEEGGDVAAAAGLGRDEFAIVLARFFPAARGFGTACAAAAPQDAEVAMVRDLLIANHSTEGEVGAWIAAVVARRAVEPNHLWEDLGLRHRSELTRLLNRHFAPLAFRNIHNMRRKRFFYRALCEMEGVVLCKTPVCTDCVDFGHCFGEETGESRLARARRILAGVQ